MNQVFLDRETQPRRTATGLRRACSMVRGDLAACWEGDTHLVLEDLADAEKLIVFSILGCDYEVLRRHAPSFGFGGLRSPHELLGLARGRNFRWPPGSLAKACLGPA